VIYNTSSLPARVLLHRAGGLLLPFYAKALDTMKSTCTSLALLTVA
jgi:hypothetical protein